MCTQSRAVEQHKKARSFEALSWLFCLLIPAGDTYLDSRQVSDEDPMAYE